MSNSVRSITPALVKITIFAVVTVLLTGALGATIVSANFGPQSGYTAVFSSASGLGAGDDVRIAGVRVGEVTSVETVEVDGETRAKARFTIRRGRKLPVLVTATVRYKNLIGQRYLDLGTDVPRDGETLDRGDTIPVDRTEPALDLTALFNGFKPLFNALDPEQVNKLSGNIIQVFQGQGSTVRSLLAHTASLTSTVARKDEVIGRVIDNLNTVLDTVNDRGPRVGELVDVTQRLVSGLAEQRGPIGEAIGSLGELTETTASLFDRLRQPLRDDIAHLDRLSGNLLQAEELLDHLLQVTPGNLRDFTNSLSYGSWYNYYLCGLTARLGVGENYVEVPLLPLPGSKRPERCGP